VSSLPREFLLRVNLPSQLLNHPVVFTPDLVSKKEGDALLRLLKSDKMKRFPTNAGDLKFYETKHEHIGEAQAINAAGRCDHPFLIPNKDRSLCILPGRIDIAKHWMMYGGVAGFKEQLDRMASRLQSFGRYIFNPEDYPEMQAVFKSKKFLDLSRSVCPASKQYLDPFQFNFIIQVPSQTVALHVDGVYFRRATRFQFPQYLLAAMKFSGLWEEDFVDQVQVVGYLHQWNNTEEREGSFVYWTENQAVPRFVRPEPFAGSAVDGSKTVHAAAAYMPNAAVPKIDKSVDTELVYVGNEKWKIAESKSGRVIQNYTTDDLRITIVYRGRCFENEAEAKLFRDTMYKPDAKEALKLEDILSTLHKDLIKRGRLADGEARLPPLEMAMLIVDEYIKYPLPPKAWFPFNYCALGKLSSVANVLLSPICSS